MEILDFPSVGEQDRVRIQSKPICDILKDLKALSSQRVYNDVEIPTRIPLKRCLLLKILDEMEQTFNSNWNTSILQPLERIATSQASANQNVDKSDNSIISKGFFALIFVSSSSSINGIIAHSDKSPNFVQKIHLFQNSAKIAKHSK